VEDDVEFKDLVEEILTNSGYSDQRASKMDVDDLLKLLACFNKQGM
jgi:18S rRNA (adenine1779-N6/adenine1780-N6)-dimethyltransferase